MQCLTHNQISHPNSPALRQSLPYWSQILALVHVYTTNDLPDDVICNIAIYADDATLHSKCDQASDLWQQLELVSEFEFDL